MASTRKKAQMGDYKMEQKIYERIYNYKHDTMFSVTPMTCHPGDGLIGMKATPREFSTNFADVESYLFGIGCCDMVNPGRYDGFKPELKDIKSLNVRDKYPRILPDPLVLQPGQRPMYLS